MFTILLGAIAAAREFFKIPLEDIIDAVESFKGVPGRIEHLYDHNGMDVILDYGHNPAGIETVLRELKKVYNNNHSSYYCLFRIWRIWRYGNTR